MNKKIKKILNKKNKSKIVCLTSYSKNIAEILDKHCDIVLVGDSLGSVLYNFKSTKEVTLQTMINHSKSVRLGVNKSLMVFDMPYNTYRNPQEALKNAKLVIKETKCDAVKLEGRKKIIPIVKKLIQMQDALAKRAKADKTCPVSTGIFLRIAVEASIEEQKKQKLKKPKLPFWRIIDENMPIFKKLSISKSMLNKYKRSEFNEKN